MALLYAYGQASQGVASSIRDTPQDDLSIRKSNVLWPLGGDIRKNPSGWHDPIDSFFLGNLHPPVGHRRELVRRDT